MICWVNVKMDFAEGSCHESVYFEAQQPMGRGDSVGKV